jgi:hypothetical protein
MEDDKKQLFDIVRENLPGIIAVVGVLVTLSLLLRGCTAPSTGGGNSSGNTTTVEAAKPPTPPKWQITDVWAAPPYRTDVYDVEIIYEDSGILKFKQLVEWRDHTSIRVGGGSMSIRNSRFIWATYTLNKLSKDGEWELPDKNLRGRFVRTHKISDSKIFFDQFMEGKLITKFILHHKV